MGQSMEDQNDESVNYLEIDEKPQVSGSVVIADIDIPFWSLVILLVKFAFAVIPATIIIAIVVKVFSTLFAGLAFT